MQRLWNILVALTPHPSAMYEAIEDELPRLEDFISPRDLANCYAGMSAEQLAELAGDSLFSIGVHTVDHPFLTRCEPAEALRQIRDNRAWIEETCGHTCDGIAYPGGDYDGQVIGLCRAAGLSRGYCLSRSVNLTPQMEIPRLGIYSTSTDVLGLKAQWGSLMRSMHLPVG
jgi:peptidoglycan/xylan/chitin deacetylase (PgdA/CDA1 family)